MARARDKILKIAWLLSAAICVFTAENLWIDPWLQRKSHHKLPSFVPESLGGVWFLILLALIITVIFLVVCQVLLMRDTTLPRRRKAVTGILVAAAVLLSGGWLVATSGTTFATRSAAGEDGAPQKRSVVLRWQASTTPNVKYNVYRGLSSGIHPDRLNSTLLNETTFTDTNVVSGRTYWYVVRAVNAQGQESYESNQTSVTVP
jgi:hypothetical protein